jgi:hypothetical protein
MAPFLHPCESCARHIRAAEAACPFCGVAVTDVAPPAARGPMARPMSRAALLFMSATATAGCSSSEPVALYGPAVIDSGADTGEAIEDSGAETGAPAVDSGPASVDSGPSEFDGGLIAAYGPAPYDAG